MNRELVNTDAAPAAIGPYSQAVKVGNLVFTSGQIPLDPATGAVVEGDIAKQTHRVLENLRAVLEGAGTSMDNLIKTTIFISDMNEFGVINQIYAEYTSKAVPARSCVEVARLPKDVRIEIEAIALI